MLPNPSLPSEGRVALTSQPLLHGCYEASAFIVRN